MKYLLTLLCSLFLFVGSINAQTPSCEGCVLEVEYTQVNWTFVEFLSVSELVGISPDGQCTVFWNPDPTSCKEVPCDGDLVIEFKLNPAPTTTTNTLATVFGRTLDPNNLTTYLLHVFHIQLNNAILESEIVAKVFGQCGGERPFFDPHGNAGYFQLYAHAYDPQTGKASIQDLMLLKFDCSDCVYSL